MFNSELHDEKTFYKAFLRDLSACREEVIIESPFITSDRMKMLKSAFERLISRGIKVYVITRDPKEHDNGYDVQSEKVILYFEALGVQVLLCSGNHHRKLAILDRKILWEGSLNILSQTHSREIMRRIESEEVTMEMFNFLNLGKHL
jgi:phosphatidylserine/phosphatidylglycerophosphate/cardiolipin synthase-like enzyme